MLSEATSPIGRLRISIPQQGNRVLNATPDVLERLYHLADQVGRARGLEDVCEAALDAIVDLVGAERSSILMFDERQVMRFKAWRGLSASYRAAVDGHSPWTPEAPP